MIIIAKFAMVRVMTRQSDMTVGQGLRFSRIYNFLFEKKNTIRKITPSEIMSEIMIGQKY